MSACIVVLLGVVVALLGCGNTYAPPVSPVPQQPRPPSTEIDDKMNDLLTRSKAAQAGAEAAVKLDGSDQAQKAFEDVRGCNRDTDFCTRKAAADEGLSKVGAQAGFAAWLVREFAGLSPTQFRTLYFTDVFGKGTTVVRRGFGSGDGVFVIHKVEPSLVQAEDLVKQATEAAKVVGARATRKAEEDACIEAAKDCDAQGARYCEDKCGSGDAKYCEVWAVHLWKNDPPDFAKARTAMQRSCSGGLGLACKLVADLDAAEKKAGDAVNALWLNVAGEGDRFASNRYTLAMVLKLRPTPKNQRDVATARKMEPGMIAERYCPARAVFIKATSLAEFRKRAAAHCKDSPPTAQGPTGAEVPLPEQCSEVFAISCP